MAIKLTDKPNTEPVSGAYPYGAIKDNIPSVQAGTPVNKLVMEDYLQFFHRLMALYSVTYNDLAENNTNGFQFVEALQKAIEGNNNFVGAGAGWGLWNNGGSLAVAANTGTFTSFVSHYNRYRIKGHTLYWQFSFSADFQTTIDYFTVDYPTALGQIKPILGNQKTPQVIDKPDSQDINSVTIVSRNIAPGVFPPGIMQLAIYPTYPTSSTPQFGLGVHRIYVNLVIELTPN